MPFFVLLYVFVGVFTALAMSRPDLLVIGHDPPLGDLVDASLLIFLLVLCTALMLLGVLWPRGPTDRPED